MVNLTAKKVQCPKCLKLVRVKLQQTGEKAQYYCGICNTLVWQKEGLKWKYNKNI